MLNRGLCVVAVLAAVLVGAAMAMTPRLALPLFGALIVLCASFALGPRQMVYVLLIASFGSRLAVEIASVSLRLEHAAAISAALLLVLRKPRQLVSSALATPSILLAAFVLWNGVVSVGASPDLLASLRVVGWMGFDWLTFVVIVGLCQWAGIRVLELLTMGVRTVLAVVAVEITLAASAARGLTGFGVQVDPVSNLRQAYGISYEANILGGALACWIVVVVAVSFGSRRLRSASLIALPLGLVLTLTRAAMLGAAVGLAVWQLALLVQRRRVAVGRVILLGVVFSVLYFQVPVARQRATDMVNFSAGTGRQRTDTWTTALNDISGTAWIVGLGTNSFGQRHLEATRPDLALPGYIGNMPLQLVYDTGLIGAVLLGSVWVSVLPQDRVRRVPAYAVSTAFLVAAIATSPLWFATTWTFAAAAHLARRSRDGP